MPSKLQEILKHNNNSEFKIINTPFVCLSSSISFTLSIIIDYCSIIDKHNLKAPVQYQLGNLQVSDVVTVCDNCCDKMGWFVNNLMLRFYQFIGIPMPNSSKH